LLRAAAMASPKGEEKRKEKEERRGKRKPARETKADIVGSLRMQLRGKKGKRKEKGGKRERMKKELSAVFSITATIVSPTWTHQVAEKRKKERRKKEEGGGKSGAPPCPFSREHCNTTLVLQGI